MDRSLRQAGILKARLGVSLGVQWLRLQMIPLQEVWVPSLVKEATYATRCGQIKKHINKGGSSSLSLKKKKKQIWEEQLH